MNSQIHDFQATILRELLFNPHARFSDLNKVGITNDHFTFHVNKLIKDGLIEKSENCYVLTQTGKELANRLDTDTLQFERQAKVAIAIHATKIVNGKKEYLVHKRLKEPFFGWYGSHSGKIRWGETPYECAKREFMEETGLSADFTLKGIVHYLHFFKDGKLLEDKYFWVFEATNLVGELQTKIEGGENIWMNEDKIKSIKNIFATLDEMKETLDSPTLVYIDRNKIVDSY